MRVAALAVLGLLVLPLVAEAAPSVASVFVRNTRFVDESGDDRTQVAPGGTVTWVWESGPVRHTATQTLGAWVVGVATEGFESGAHASPHSFSVTFPDVGVHQYQCAIHSSMTGTIVVQP